jgi:hypothetical protein
VDAHPGEVEQSEDSLAIVENSDFGDSYVKHGLED